MEESKIKTLLVEFINLDKYEKQEIIAMLKAQSLVSAIEKIGNDIFRPARKHGYEKEIEDLIDICGVDSDGYSNGYELINKLEEKFYEILNDKDISDLLL